MKRKLDINDIPMAGVSSDNPVGGSRLSTATFESLGLDHRLLQAISKQKYSEPTLVQAKAIPLAIQGKDILAKSKTGTGKTAAYVLPTLQLVLQHKSIDPKAKTILVLVLIPTKELSDQVTKVYTNLGEFCSKEIRCLNLTQRASDAVLTAKLQEHPDIVISTPSRVVQLLASGTLSLENLQQTVIDEADLVLSYGYADDMSVLSKTLPKGIQTFLMSATLTPEIGELQATFCRDPVVIKIDDGEQQGQHAAQYVVKCGEEEKFLLIFVIFKLKLVKGKCIIFVADVDRSYRLKLYLEQYGIKSCVLNSELPVNSRLQVVEEFNKGLFDIMVAADDQEVIGGIHKKPRQRADDADVELTDEDEYVDANKRKQEKDSRDYGVSRGIDFQNVSCVLNFDLPPSSKSYTHRIGRTARAGRAGMALSFVIPHDEYGRHKPTSQPTCRHDEKVLAKIVARQEKKGHEIKPYQFDMDQVAAFRYRMNDALRAVTRVAVREARAREIKQELVRSEKLRKHFEENPEDLKHLRRSDGGALGGGGVIRIQGHMKHVPEYLLPEKGRQSAESAKFVGINGDENHKKRKRKGFKKSGRKGGKNDPLKTFRTARK